MDEPSPPPQARKVPTLNITKPAQDATAALPPLTPERKSKAKIKITSLETVPESDPQAHHASPPDDASKPIAKTPPIASPNDKDGLAEKRSQYFHEALHERSRRNPAMETVLREALVYAQVKTNKTQIENEHYFLTTFSHQLAARYNRYPSSTVVSLHHSQCLLFGGSLHPAYTLTITALPCEVQPATNKRNAAVLQKHMEAVLRVPPSRGMVRFIPAAEECLAWGGKTVAGRISDAAARDRDVTTREGEGVKVQERRILKSLSLRRSSPAKITPPSTETPTPSKNVQAPNANLITRIEATDFHGPEESVGVVRKKKSIIDTLFRTSRVGEDD
ncbi:Tautomerase/MIF superfamily [Trichoderma ceciliae]